MKAIWLCELIRLSERINANPPSKTDKLILEMVNFDWEKIIKKEKCYRQKDENF